jgi:outer membrane protein insertion porin family
VKKSFITLGLFFGCLMADGFGDTLRRIEIHGNKRIQREAIAAHMRLEVGDDISPHIVDDMIKRLYATGFFSNLSAELKNGNLTLFVTENSMINRVAFEGNKAIKDEHIKLLTKDRVEPHQVLRRSEVQNVMRDLLHMYRAKGYLTAVVTPKIIKLPESRVDVVFEVIEGKPTTIKKILFVGNKTFSTSTLRSEMQSKEATWWRFWGYDDVYSPERIDSDKRALKKFYNNHGFAAFHVKSHLAELSLDRKNFYLTFSVEEGGKYKFGTVEIDCELKKIDISALRKKVAFKSGSIFKIDEIDKTKEAFVDDLGALGYAFVNVYHTVKLDDQNHVANITFHISKASKVFIERIEICGNNRTLDKVVRREFRLHEGDPMNVVKLRKSIQRIRDLDYFSIVEAQPEEGSAADKAVVKVDVEEKSTGQFKLAGGYSASDGLLSNFGVKERNFFGSGKTVDVDLMLAGRTKSISFGVMDPYFMDRDLVAGGRIGGSIVNRVKETSAEARSFGISPYIGYQITENLGHRITYGLSVENIKFKSQIMAKKLASAPSWIKESYGHFVGSTVSSVLMYNQVDSTFYPKDGYTLGLENSFAGVGGNVHFNRHEFNASWYYPLAEKLTFWSSGTIGIMGGGRVKDRFSLGGESFRGFEYDGIGPRTKTVDQDSVHGTRYYKVGFGVKCPIGNYYETGIKCTVFTEWGSLWKSKISKELVFDDSSLRGSIGVGIEWLSPFGPISLSFAWAIKKCKYDQTQVMQFGGLM